MAKNTQLATAAQNAAVDAIVALANGGTIKGYTAGSGVPADANTALTDQVLLFTMGLASPAFAAAAAGVATANAITPDVAADNTGTLAFFRVLNSGGACVWQGTVAATGGSANLILPTLSIVQGQQVGASAMTFTQAASSAT